MVRRAIQLLVLTLLVLPGAAGAESLYEPQAGDLFTSLHARNVGDILTVVISESTKAQRSVSTDVEKAPKYSGGAKVEGFFDIISGLGSIIEPLKAVDIDPKEEFESKASTEAAGKFTGRMTVIVREVLPNGNLLIEGKRSIQINKETEALTLTGVVRVYDIGADNTILSHQIADADIDFTGKGIVSRGQKDGLLGKLFNLIF